MKGLAWYQDAEDTPSKHEPPDPPLTSRRTRPIPDPCPVCLKHIGHYPERHGNAWCTLPGCTDGNPFHDHETGPRP